MNTIAFNKFIVVAWYEDIPYMLQGRGVIGWCFYNNHLKVYKSLKTAIKGAYKVVSKYKCHCVKVYRIYDADERIGGDAIRMWEREQPERIVFEHKPVIAA
jgi:hypothetical protein